MIRTLALLLVISTTVYAKPVKVAQALAPNTIMLDGGIEMQILIRTAVQVTAQGETVHLYINSPGGDFMGAKSFVSFMDQQRAKGKSFTCYAGPMVASAAFYIYLHCDQRLALKSSVLFPHKIHIYYRVPVLPAVLVQDGHEAAEEQRVWDTKARGITGMNVLDYQAFRDSDDKFWTIEQIQAASTIQWFKVVDYYTVRIGP